MLQLIVGPPARAEVDLHDGLCVSAPSRVPVRPGDTGGLPECGGPAPADGRVHYVLRDARRLNGLGAGWSLILENNRFADIAITATARDGDIQRIVRRGDRPGDAWRPGGRLGFVIARPGAALRTLDIAYRDMDGPGFVRRFVARDASEQAFWASRWVLLIGAVVGMLSCAAMYNFMLYLELRCAFQLWYICWTLSTLTYETAWANGLGFLDAALTGPFACRLSLLCLGLMMAAGVMFLRSLIEPEARHRTLSWVGRPLAGLAALSGIAAALDRVLPAAVTDMVLNVVLIIGTLWLLAMMAVALRRRSRVIVYYLIGWAPVICMLCLGLACNAGLFAEGEALDMAALLSLLFEAMALSMVTGHRLRTLRGERQAIEARAEAEIVALRRVTLHDTLTGLASRPAFMHALETHDGPAALMLIDVDRIGRINESFGFRQGDALLRHVGRRLRDCAPPDVMLARIAGDTFACLLDPTQAPALGDRIDALQGEPWTFGGHTLSLSLSIGDAWTGAQTPDRDRLFDHAGAALAEARRLGRGRRVSHSDTIAGRYDRDAELFADIGDAIAKGELQLYFQPIVDLRDGRMLGEEALLRWNHPRHGLLSPGSFAALLESESWGPIVQDHVLTMAIGRLERTRDVPGYVTVNFTGAQMRDPSTARHILARLTACDIPSQRLCIEVTEHVALDEATLQVVEALTLLHDAGVRVALDDFGTGYATLRHLRLMPIDIIKIDRSFVAASETDTDEILRAIISLGQALDKLVIAEGVETEAQRLRLLALGCRSGQGYLFCEPLAEDRLPRRGEALCVEDGNGLPGAWPGGVADGLTAQTMNRAGAG